MNQIYKNLVDPSWWFTGIFFVVIGLILTKLFFNWLPYFFEKMKNYVPTTLSNISRWNQKRILLLIKHYRHNDLKIVWLIGRYWSLFILASVYLGLILIYFSTTNISDKALDGLAPKVIGVAPCYLMMLALGAHKQTLGKVIKENLRLKRKASLRAKESRNL